MPRMKKLFSIALLFIYLIASVGILFNFQYCCGKLKAVELYSIGAPSELFQQKCQEKDMGKDCCKSDIKVVKTENDQNKTNALQISCPSYPVHISSFSFLIHTAVVAVAAPSFKAPLKVNRRTYLDNCVLII